MSSRACPASGACLPSPLDSPLADLRCLLHPKPAAWDHLLVGDDDPEKRIAGLGRQFAEQEPRGQQAQVVGAPEAGLRQRWRLARGMVKVTGPNGVQWTVYGRWFPNWTRSCLPDTDRGGDLDTFFLAVVWPPWFIAKWFGVRWIILVERNGREVGEVRVRGWRKSQRRIHEIAEAAVVGTLQKEL